MSLSVFFSLQHLEHLEETGPCPVSCKQHKRMMGMLCLLAHSDAKLWHYTQNLMRALDVLNQKQAQSTKYCISQSKNVISDTKQ